MRKGLMRIDLIACALFGTWVAWYTGSLLLGLACAVLAMVLPEWLLSGGG